MFSLRSTFVPLSSLLFLVAGDLIDGLHGNGIDHYTHLLTGYIGSTSFLHKVKSVVEHLKTVNPKLIYGESGSISIVNLTSCFS